MTLHFGNFPQFVNISKDAENCQNERSFGNKWLWKWSNKKLPTSEILEIRVQFRLSVNSALETLYPPLPHIFWTLWTEDSEYVWQFIPHLCNTLSKWRLGDQFLGCFGWFPRSGAQITWQNHRFSWIWVFLLAIIILIYIPYSLGHIKMISTGCFFLFWLVRPTND